MVENGRRIQCGMISHVFLFFLYFRDKLESDRPSFIEKLHACGNAFQACAKDQDNVTPLHWLCKLGHVGMCRSLISIHPEQLLVCDVTSGQTPLHWACVHGHADVVSVIVRLQVDLLSMPDLKGQTPVHVACVFGHVDVMSEIVRLVGGNALLLRRLLYQRDANGRMPIINAVCWGRTEMLTYLLSVDPTLITVRSFFFCICPLLSIHHHLTHTR